MRLSVTVVSPATRRVADIVLTADPATPVAQVAAELARFARGCPQARLPAGPGNGPGDPALASQAGPVRPANATRGDHQPLPHLLSAPVAFSSGPSPGPSPSPSPGSGTVGDLASVPLYVDGKRLSPLATLADSPLRDGAVISLGSPDGCLAPEPAGLAEIRVVAGPGAGAIHRLGPGAADIGGGRPGTVTIALPDPSVPAPALRIAVGATGNCLVAAYDGVAATRDLAALDGGPAPWLPGQQITIGATTLSLARYEPPDAALAPSPDGAGVDFNRPPRLLPPARVTRFALPAPPAPHQRRPLPILMSVLPLVMGVAMAFFLHQAYLLAMAALSPVMLLGSALTERRSGRKAAAGQQAEYDAHKARIEREAADAVAAERAARREQCPDPATVLSIATGPRSRLWERRRTDPDYLLLRVGTADLPSAVELTDPVRDEHRRTVVPQVTDAPVTIPLPERRVVGLCGHADSARAAGRWIVAQAAVLHSPNDLRIYVLTDAAGRAAWEWVRWLPHCRPAQASYAAQVGNDAETVAARIAELLVIVSQRREALGQQAPGPPGGDGPGQVRFRTTIMVVLDGSRKLRALPGIIQLLSEGPDVGVYAVCLDSEERLLPAECHAVAVFGASALRVRQMMTPDIDGARPDHAAPGWCARVARAIAPIRDVSDDGDSDGLPDEARLLDVLGLEPPTATSITARWRAGGRSTVAMLGESYDGPFGIDIKKDGPHGLIAGTTGSGKSELLQTIIASLAVANRPDEMTFVLIDYKGGSAFADCARLPHTVGMVTDLSPHLVERALTSLSAELTRREHLLAAAGAKDIEDYQRELDRPKTTERHTAPRAPGAMAPAIGRAPGGTGGRPPGVPRLVIVIDEFASMVRELPDFVTGLVNLAQRGRSLGIHLLLATQRPSGVVSADIRANTNLRIALRVTDAGESSDVLDAPNAASITKATPGRGYVRLGHASLLPFQAGRIGGPRPSPGPAPAAPDPSPPWLAPVEWTALGRPEPAPPAPRRRADDELTDLKVLVAQLRRAAADLGIPAQPSPWLPPLPESVQLTAVWPADARDTATVDSTAVPFGIIDLPERQLQPAADLSPRAFSHLMAAGAPRSGRSQLLRTIAAALALGYSCADVHLYGIDCGNGALLPLADLPHCGAVVSRSETERAARLLRRLDREVTRRQELLAAGGFADITEQRAAAGGTGAPLPHVFVMLDRWEGFTVTFGELDGGALADIITRVLGEGASAGVHLVMTGDRSLLAGRISSLCEEKLVFKMAEKEDYALAGLRPRELPGELPPGRALRAGSGAQVQVALLGEDATGQGATGQGQASALRDIARSCAVRDTAVAAASRPFRVDAAPARITFSQAWALRPGARGADGGTGTGGTGTGGTAAARWGLVGVGGDSLQALGPDLSTGVPAFVVAGPSGSGRSTILLTLARSFLAAGTPVVLVTPRPSPLASLAGEAGVLRALAAGTGLEEDEVTAALALADRPGVLLIDDADLLRDCDASGVLSQIVAGASGGGGWALAFAGDPEAGLCAGFGGWQVEAKRGRRGCLTAPAALGDGDLIGARLTRSMVGQAARPGRCLLNTGNGQLVTVTVPLG